MPFLGPPGAGAGNRCGCKPLREVWVLGSGGSREEFREDLGMGAWEAAGSTEGLAGTRSGALPGPGPLPAPSALHVHPLGLLVSPSTSLDPAWSGAGPPFWFLPESTGQAEAAWSVAWSPAPLGYRELEMWLVKPRNWVLN